MAAPANPPAPANPAPVQAPAAQPAQAPAAQPANPAAQPAAPSQLAILANKPGEPAFVHLKLDLDKLAFKSDKLNEEPVTVELTISNTTAKKQCFKVRPPLGFVEANSSTKVQFTFQSKIVPEQNKHFFALYSMTVADADIKETMPRKLWSNPAAKPEGVKRLLCTFEKADGTPWPVEKK